jgi:glycosyltransferase involved in cell wall biosynthesis
MTNTVLFVTDVCIHPSHGGEHIRCHNLIDSLCQHFAVSVLAPPMDAACKLIRDVQAWHELPRQLHRSILTKANEIVSIVAARPSWSSCLEATCQQHKPQVVWFSYGHWGQYVTIPRRIGARTIMDTHNVQSELTKQEYESLPLGKSHLANRLRYIAQRAHEHHLFRRFDRIVSVSEADRQYHARFVGKGCSIHIPNYIKETTYHVSEPLERKDNTVVMTGNFGAFQNREGLMWFLNESWPRVRQRFPQARLQLIGRGSSDLFGEDLPPGVTSTGYVQTTALYLRQATVAIVPLFYGSGTRFKILEAWACETPVVSTTLGAQGINLVSGHSVILADSGTEFAHAIVGLLQDRKKRSQLAKNGLNRLKTDYGFEVNTQRIRQLIEAVLAK